MKQACYRERSYRKSICGGHLNRFFFQMENIKISGEVMMAKARSFGSKAHLEQAQNMKMPSCDNLGKIGLSKYMPNTY